jgi:ubiquinone/menaquinone biosynthesis C-methylase UbiE
MYQRGQSQNVSDPGVEGDLLRIALERRRGVRLLDLGCGTGRLSQALVNLTTQYVGVDLESRPLRVVRARFVGEAAIALVRAEVGRLPFCDASFSTAVMVRLYHRLSDPTAVLGEIRRLLQPGGTLIVAVYPKPTLSTLVHDIWTRLSPQALPHSITFSRSGRVEVRTGQNPAFVETLEVTRTRLRDLGFRIVRELGYGYEELPVVRRLPRVFWTRLEELSWKPHWFPCVIIVALRE